MGHPPKLPIHIFFAAAAPVGILPCKEKHSIVCDKHCTIFQGGVMHKTLWKPSYLLDIESIDAQHKHFFELCAKLTYVSESCKEKCIERTVLIRAIYDLRLYAFYHFNTEETLMVKYGYNHCLHHFKEHDNYLGQIRSFVDELAGGSKGSSAKDNAELSELASRLSDWASVWWAEHILEHDQRYAKFIKKKKAAIQQ